MTYSRSPELLNATDSALLVVDVQQKLLPTIFNAADIEPSIARLVDGANILGVPVLHTEQYPKGLGASVKSLSSRIADKPTEKITFSCLGSEEFKDRLAGTKRQKVVVCGMETHICVQQTAFDLLAQGYSVFLATDSVGARDEKDHSVAMRRMEASGVCLTTTEATLFEWCERAGTKEFKSIQKLIIG